ncbi:MAG: hypothetical protein ACTS6J_02100 [Burkholderiales bacterium]
MEITRYVSTVGYVSEPADTPANQLYSGRISGGVQFTRRLALDGSGGSVSFGGTEFDNEDGELDDWLNDIWAGRAINYYMGDAGDATRGIAKWPRSQFELVFSGTAHDILPKARNRLELSTRDIFGPLNSTLSTATVGGTGDNKDALRPVLLGECFNITPVLLDPTAGGGKYAVHLADDIEGVLEVRDNGVPVAFTQDVTLGNFTLTNARFGTITCDAQGATVPTGSPAVEEWRNDAGGLIEWVATGLVGDGNALTAGQIDAAALTTFRAANAQPIGLYNTDRGNKLAAMQQLAASVGATVTTTYDGKLILVRVGFGAPAGEITTLQMVDGSFGPIGRPDVQGTIRLNGQRNWTPNQSGLAGSLTGGQLTYFRDEYIQHDATDATVVADWNQDVAPEPVDTLMVVAANLDTEAARRLALWKVAHEIFGFEGFPETLAYEIGDTKTLTHPRFGLSAGATCQIVGISDDWINVRRQIEVLV